MVLTKPELVSSLQNEVRILLHLAGKVDRTQLDYRPTAKQRSTLDLVRYLSMMGPTMTRGILAGNFDESAWTAEEQSAMARSFDEALAVIAAQSDAYASIFAGVTDADLRSEIDLFGFKGSKGLAIVSWVLNGYAAYRTQLFLYLKACGRDDLNTMNLWAGVDGEV